METTARALETTFRRLLTVALPGIPCRTTNEPVPVAPNAQRVPSVTIEAVQREEWLALKVAGRVGCVCDIKLTCRHHDAQGAESLAAQAVQAVAAAMEALVAELDHGWLFLQVEPRDETREFSDATREIALNYTARCLTSPD